MKTDGDTEKDTDKLDKLENDFKKRIWNIKTGEKKRCLLSPPNIFFLYASPLDVDALKKRVK